ncbi:Sec23-binding domain of Sec16-domain-containing protein [Kalaharituber pfeilii]|nr:Sec23-binding domain of Sec16-domain-containing protein [Kalaharituber pfeilii]
MEQNHSQSEPSSLESEASLPRVASSASFVAEACHIEDVNAGCQVHTHSSDIGLPRHSVGGGFSTQGQQPIPESKETEQQQQQQQQQESDSGESQDAIKDSASLDLWSKSSLPESNYETTPESPTKRTPTINLSAAKEPDPAMPPIPPTPMVVPPTPSLSTHVPQVQDGRNEIPSSLRPELNWGFDSSKSESLSGQETAAYAAHEADAPIPPTVTSKPQSEISSEDETGDTTHSPFGDYDDGSKEDSELLNSISAQAASVHNTQAVQPNSMFDTLQIGRQGFDGFGDFESGKYNNDDDESNFFSALGNADTSTREQNQQQQQPSDFSQARWEEGVPLPQQQNDADTHSAERSPENAGPSFFNEEPSEYEGGDFFSSTNTQLPAAAEGKLQRKSTTQVVASALENKPHDAANTISDLFSETTPEEADFFANPTQAQGKPKIEEGEEAAKPDADDIAAKWKAALADDDLLDEDFLPDDGEGFLSSSDEEDVPPPKPVVGVTQGYPNAGAPTSAAAARYSSHASAPPQNPYQPPQQPYPPRWQAPPNPYTPAQQPAPSPYAPVAAPAYVPQAATAPYYPPQAAPPPPQYTAPPSRVAPPAPPAPKAQSFVDKKGAYQSPYDLPMEVVKPAISKRVSMPQMSSTLISPPPRQSSFGATTTATPPLAQGAFGQPKHTSPLVAPPTGPPPTAKAKPSPAPKQAFFEELPIAKTRPAPRPHSTAQQQAPGMMRSGSLPEAPPRPSSMTQTAYQPPPPPAPAPSLGPAPVFSSKYASPPSVAPATPTAARAQYPSVPPTPPATSHYSPATAPATLPPPQGLMSPPQIPPYQRAPSAPLASTGTESKYAPRPASAALQQSPPQRQVSAPLTFGADGGSDGSQHTQQSSPNQNRFPGEHHLHSSRPSTAKSTGFAAAIGVVKEEDEAAVDGGADSTAPPSSISASKHAPRSAATPPPTAPPMRGVNRAGAFSPPARSGSPYQQIPSRTASPEQFAPPRRARTQSPSTVLNGPNRTVNQYQPQRQVQRPASALAGNTSNSYTDFSPLEQHTRSMSTGIKSYMNDPVNFIPPTDTSVQDPLNRWQGCPIFSWGFGGHVVTMFPSRTQRNVVGSLQPMIKCSPGEVKVRSIKEVLPLEDSVVKFPGPVYTGSKGGKAKKKEVLAWMAGKIEKMEREATEAGIALPGEAPRVDEGDRKRQEEKILLWKGMKLLLEHDGVLEGVEAEKAARAFIWSEEPSPTSPDSFNLVASLNSTAAESGPSVAADRVDPEAMKKIKSLLLIGDRTSAVWHAVDKRLWSHAMLIAGTVSTNLWKQVVQDFVRNEVKTLGKDLESLAVLYEIFGGNGEESIDELVPQSARLGQPMMTNITGTVSARNPLDGLEKWRETLSLIVSNRSAGDSSAIMALSKLLGSYARIEAAHLCLLFARNASVFSGSEDPHALVTLFGADHVYSPFDFWRDTDAILLSEVYELVLSLLPAPATPPLIPHLQGIKLYHAFMLAENGYRTEAQKYCDAIASVLKLSGKPSPYFHRNLFTALEELSTRVSQSPKDAAASGWLSKPSLDNISGSMWGAFTKFVAGEETESATPGTEHGQNTGGLLGDAGSSFGVVAASPGISRTQSTADIYGGYGAGGNVSNYSPTMPKNPRYEAVGGAANQYTPQQMYTSRPTTSANPYEPTNSNYSPYSSANSHSYNPASQQSSSQYSAANPYMPQGGYEPAAGKSTTDSSNPSNGSFDSPAATKSTFEDTSSSYTYEPPQPSYGGYEPPTSEAPATAERDSEHKKDDSADEKPKPKKKSFMDDDDDDAEFVARAAKLKQEEEEKRKKEEEEKKKEQASSGGGGWFRWFVKKDSASGGGPIKAKLGEESSFYYDPDLKRWINKKAPPEDNVPKSTPPPPKRTSGPPSRPGSAAPPQSLTASAPPPTKSASVPPMNTSYPPSPSTPTAPPPRAGTPVAPPPRAGTPSTPSNAPPSRVGTPAPPSTPGTPRSAPPPPPPASAPPPAAGAGKSAPPTRPSTAAGGDMLDDLLGGPPQPGARKAAGAAAGGKKGRKGRYVDVMAK